MSKLASVLICIFLIQPLLLFVHFELLFWFCTFLVKIVFSYSLYNFGFAFVLSFVWLRLCSVCEICLSCCVTIKVFFMFFFVLFCLFLIISASFTFFSSCLLFSNVQWWVTRIIGWRTEWRRLVLLVLLLLYRGFLLCRDVHVVFLCFDRVSRSDSCIVYMRRVSNVYLLATFPSSCEVTLKYGL